jgi:hypothetical protein
MVQQIMSTTKEIINCTFVGIRLYTIKMYSENNIENIWTNKKSYLRQRKMIT